MKLIPALSVAAATLFSAAPAMAIDTVTAKDPQGVIDALSEMGYRGTLDKMDNGRPTISLKVSGLNTFIDFYDCAEDMTDCYTLNFFVQIEPAGGATLSKANEWNYNEITGRVAIDPNGNPQLHYAVSTFEGVSYSVFEQTMRLWDRQLGNFKDFFNY